MKLLAIETSATACSIATAIDGEISSLHQILPMQQAKKMLPLISEWLKSKNITLKQLDAIAFGCGPGSFTGIRIAASIAQGLAFAYRIPVIPISSLAALAESAYREFKWEQILVATDARMGKIYYGQYKLDSNKEIIATREEMVCEPQAMPIPNSPDWYGIGNAWTLFKLPYQPKNIHIDPIPTALSVLYLAKSKYARGEWVDAPDALPIYLHNDNFLNKR